MSLVLIIHIIGGSIGIGSGFTSIFSRKGRKTHNLSGEVFFYSMSLMASTGLILSLLENQATNIIVSLLTLYLVYTARLTMKNRVGKVGKKEKLALGYILLVIVAGLIYSVQVINQNIESGSDTSLFEFFLFFYTAMAILGAILDAFMIWRGGIYGAKRVARHVWRMCFALWIACGSLFLGQPQVFPEPINDPLILSMPVIAVVLMWMFWNIRVFIGRRYRLRPHEPE